MEDSDWNELYNHLIRRLRKIGLIDFLMEIENLAVIRVGIVKQHKKPSKDVTMRSVSPEERFKLATTALKSRLIEMPLIAKKIGEYLERSPKQIKWVPDTEINELLVKSRSFTCSVFDSTENEDEEIKNRFRALEEMISEKVE